MIDQEDLERFQNDWEPKGCEVVRTIDTYDNTVERIVKVSNPHRASQVTYSLYRYFTLGDNPQIRVSVDLDGVDPDEVIQHLAEQL